MKTWIQDLLKKILGNGFLVLLIVAVFYILYLRECKRPVLCPAEDEMILKKSMWDSILAISNKPAKHDTIWLQGDIIYVPTTPSNPLPLPNPELKDTTINNYSDSIVNKQINVSYKFKVKGTLEWRKWNYKPTIERIIDSIPYPVPIDKPYPVKTPKNGLFAYGVAGGNKSAFLFGAGLDFITKKETLIGYEYQRFGNENFHSIKFGGEIRFGK